MEKIDAKINNLIKKCDSLGANATKAGKGTDKLSDACTKLKDRAEAGSAGTHKLSGALKALKTGAAVAAITAVAKAVKKLTDSYAETRRRRSAWKASSPPKERTCRRQRLGCKNTQGMG